MRSRLTKLGAALTALAALAVGGSTLASASGGDKSPAKAPAAKAHAAKAHVVKARAALKLQSVPAAPESDAADTDSIQDETGTDTAAEAGAESADSGSEAANSDGPGGWADEALGNPNADTQQEGEH